MKLVEYTKILDYCEGRKDYSPFILADYIYKYRSNWENIILKRHHQFLESFIKHGGNLTQVSKEVGFSERDLSAILLRIETQFDMYDEDNDSIFVDMSTNVLGLPNISGEFDFIELVKKEKDKKKEFELTGIDDLLEVKQETIEEQVKVKRRISDKTKSLIVNTSEVKCTLKEAIETLAEEFRCMSLRYDKLLLMKEIFSRVDDLSPIENYLPKKAVLMVDFLMRSNNVKELCENLHTSEEYVYSLMIGYKTPRRQSEKGIVLILKEGLCG